MVAVCMGWVSMRARECLLSHVDWLLIGMDALWEDILGLSRCGKMHSRPVFLIQIHQKSTGDSLCQVDRSSRRQVAGGGDCCQGSNAERASYGGGAGGCAVSWYPNVASEAWAVAEAEVQVGPEVAVLMVEAKAARVSGVARASDTARVVKDVRTDADAVGALGEARPDADAVGALGEARPDADAVGALGEARPVADAVGALGVALPDADAVGALGEVRPSQWD